jgi:H+/Cl- antiporter ClcA
LKCFVAVGIPEVKCFLNGIHISGLLRFRTLVAKVIGIILSCSAGLALGKDKSSRVPMAIRLSLCVSYE